MMHSQLDQPGAAPGVAPAGPVDAEQRKMPAVHRGLERLAHAAERTAERVAAWGALALAWLRAADAWVARRLRLGVSPLKLAALAALALVALLLLRRLPPFGSLGTDGTVYYYAALDLRHGVSPYQMAAAWTRAHSPNEPLNFMIDMPDFYVYSPFLALLLIPVTLLLTTTHAFLIFWSLLSVGCLAYLSVVLVRWTAPRARGLTYALVFALALDALLLFGPMRIQLVAGQIDLLLTALVAASWTSLQREHPIRGGVLLGLTLAVKPTFGLLLIVCLWRREWRAGAAALLSGALLTVVPFLLAPHQALVDFLGFSAFWSAPGFLRAPKSISLYGELARYTSLVPALWALFTSELAAKAAPLLSLVGVVALTSAYVPRAGRRGDLGWHYACGLSTLVMLLGSPLTEDQHLVLLVLPIGLLLAWCCERLRRGKRGAWMPIVLLLLVLLHLSLPVRNLATFSTYEGWRAPWAAYWFVGLAGLTALYLWAGRRLLTSRGGSASILAGWRERAVLLAARTRGLLPRPFGLVP